MLIKDKLERLDDLRAQFDYLRLKKQELIDSVLTPEIKQHLADIDAEFAPAFDAQASGVASLEAEIRDDILQAGTSVSAKHLQAVYSQGRVSWDTAALDQYALDHPEIAAFRKTGDPYVTIRRKA